MLSRVHQRVPHEARGPEASIEQATALYAIEHDTSAGYRNLGYSCHEAERARVQVESRLGELLHTRPSTDELSVDRSAQQQTTAGKPVNRQHAQVTEQPASLAAAAEQEVKLHTTPPTITRPSARAPPKNAPPTTIHYVLRITTGTTLRLNSDVRVEAKEWHQEWLRDEAKEHGARENGESIQIGTIQWKRRLRE